MPSNYGLWLHPLSGLAVLLAVIVARRRLSEGADPSKGARLRWIFGASVVSLLFLQLLSVLRALFATGEVDHLPSTLLGVGLLVLALLLFLLLVRRSFPAGSHP